MLGRDVLLAAGRGYAFAALVILAISLTAGVALSRDRLAAVIREGVAAKTLVDDGTNEHWIDCVAVSQELTRAPDPLLNTIVTYWVRPIHHPCDELQMLLAGPPYPYPIHPPTPYENYAYGPRHLQAIAFSMLTVEQTQALYGFLSYAAIVALFAGAWLGSRRLALSLVLPIALCLAFAFEEHRWARSINWAPPFTVGFASLGAFMLRRTTFVSRTERLAFFCFLGAIMAYLDLLQGSIPVTLSLSIVLNHFFYVAPRAYASPKEYWTTAALEALAIVGCFAAGFIALTAIRMTIVLQFVPDAWRAYVGEVLHRVSTNVNGVPGVTAVNYPEVLQRLWSQREQLTGNGLATWVLAASAAAWVAAFAGVALLWRRLERPAFVLTDLLVLAGAGAGFFVWYAALQNHTYEHAWLMVRLTGVPTAYGFAAALTVWSAYAQTRSAVAPPVQ